MDTLIGQFIVPKEFKTQTKNALEHLGNVILIETKQFSGGRRKRLSVLQLQNMVFPVKLLRPVYLD